jgi:glycosyltransferase involved in cell wall biosynthesis
MPKISVVIPAINEEKRIEKTLKGVMAQTFRDFEIIVVDGKSTDSTAKIAKKYAKVVFERRKGLSLGRNLGAKHARGSILVFIDADTVPSKNLLEEVEKVLGRKDAKFSAAGWPIYPIEKMNYSVRLGYYIASVLLVKVSILISKPTLMGTSFAARKDAFDRAGGFDGRLMTYEDWEIGGRLQKYGRIAFIDDTLALTSARRVEKWGMHGYFLYHVGNVIKYALFGTVHQHYERIR